MSDVQEKTCDYEAMSRLSEHHERFKPFVGTFRARVRMWMGPGEPMESTGTMTNTLDLGGRFLRQEYMADPHEGPFGAFEGRGFWGYNTIDNRYEGMWIDNASTMLQTEHGQVDASGKVWTMTSSMTDPASGKPMPKRSVISLQDDDHHRMEMYFTGPDGTECKAMEIEYTRI